MQHRTYQKQHQQTKGFTLVEVLISLLIMSILAMLSWRAMDTFSMLKVANQEQSDNNFILQTALNQWRVDLDAVVAIQQNISPIDFNGKVLRMTRLNRSGKQNGFLVVAWSTREEQQQTYLYRWQSPIIFSQKKLSFAWEQAAIWAQRPTSDLMKYETKIVPVDDWNIYFYIDNAWVNPQSKEAITKKDINPIPDGIKLQLDFPNDYSFTGSIIKDWVNPRMKMQAY